MNGMFQITPEYLTNYINFSMVKMIGIMIKMELTILPKFRRKAQPNYGIYY